MRNQFSCNRNTSFGKASMQTKETHTKEQKHVRKDRIENGVCHIRGHLPNGPNVRHEWSRSEEWLCNFLCNFGFCAGRNDKIISDCRNSAKYQAFADTSLGIVTFCSLLPWHQGTGDDTEYICMWVGSTWLEGQNYPVLPSGLRVSLIHGRLAVLDS